MTTMVRCTACGYYIPAAVFASSAEGACPLCRREVRATLLPALGRTPWSTAPALPEEPPGPGDAVCFYNAHRKATKTCSHCGVFISEAWSAQWGREVVCLKCLGDLRNVRKDPKFEARRVLWDNIALGAALLPGLVCVALLFLGPLGAVLMTLPLIASMVTAPMALGLSVYAWNKPRSMVPRGRARVVWALLLSILQCAGWAALAIGWAGGSIFR